MARFGMELGYHVTLAKDATAAFDHAGMHAAHDVNGPRFAHAILITKDLFGRPASRGLECHPTSGNRRSFHEATRF